MAGKLMVKVPCCLGLLGSAGKLCKICVGDHNLLAIGVWLSFMRVHWFEILLALALSRVFLIVLTYLSMNPFDNVGWLLYA